MRWIAVDGRKYNAGRGTDTPGPKTEAHGASVGNMQV